MTDANTIQIDEDILSDTVSDEALEAAAGTAREMVPYSFPTGGYETC
jgi:hypothetical protein